MLLQQWYKVDTPDGLKNFNNPMGNFSWNNHFRLPWGIGLDVDLSAITAGSQDNWQQTEAGWSADFSILKTFLNERLSLQLQGTDLFNSSQARAVQYNSKRTTLSNITASVQQCLTSKPAALSALRCVTNSTSQRASIKVREQGRSSEAVCNQLIVKNE